MAPKVKAKPSKQAALPTSQKPLGPGAAGLSVKVVGWVSSPSPTRLRSGKTLGKVTVRETAKSRASAAARLRDMQAREAACPTAPAATAVCRAGLRRSTRIAGPTCKSPVAASTMAVVKAVKTACLAAVGMSGPQRSARSAAAKSNKKAVAELDIVAPAAAKTPSLLAEPLPLAPAAQMASKDDGGSVAQAMQATPLTVAEPRELEAAEGLLALAGSGALAPAAGVVYEATPLTVAEPRELEAAEGLLALAGSGALAPAAGVVYEAGNSMVQAVPTPPTSTVKYLGRSLVDSSSKENLTPISSINKVAEGFGGFASSPARVQLGQEGHHVRALQDITPPAKCRHPAPPSQLMQATPAHQQVLQAAAVAKRADKWHHTGPCRITFKVGPMVPGHGTVSQADGCVSPEEGAAPLASPPPSRSGTGNAPPPQLDLDLEPGSHGVSKTHISVHSTPAKEVAAKRFPGAHYQALPRLYRSAPEAAQETVLLDAFLEELGAVPTAFSRTTMGGRGTKVVPAFRGFTRGQTLQDPAMRQAASVHAAPKGPSPTAPPGRKPQARRLVTSRAAGFDSPEQGTARKPPPRSAAPLPSPPPSETDSRDTPTAQARRAQRPSPAVVSTGRHQKPLIAFGRRVEGAAGAASKKAGSPAAGRGVLSPQGPIWREQRTSGVLTPTGLCKGYTTPTPSTKGCSKAASSHHSVASMASSRRDASDAWSPASFGSVSASDAGRIRDALARQRVEMDKERAALLASVEGRVAQLAASYGQLLAEQAAQSAARIAELQRELAQAKADQMAAEVTAMQQATMLAVYQNLQSCHP